MNEDELKFKDLSLKDKVLSIIMTIVLLIFYVASSVIVMFVILPLRINLWCNIVTNYLSV